MDQQAVMNEKIFDDSAACERKPLINYDVRYRAGGNGFEGQERSAEARARLKCTHASCVGWLSAQGLVRHASRRCAVLLDRRMPLPHVENRVLLGPVS
jgi:hypothetical protein